VKRKWFQETVTVRDGAKERERGKKKREEKEEDVINY
jgi:hypothetical protein